jgi:hypothetical protein
MRSAARIQPSKLRPQAYDRRRRNNQLDKSSDEVKPWPAIGGVSTASTDEPGNQTESRRAQRTHGISFRLAWQCARRCASGRSVVALFHLLFLRRFVMRETQCDRGPARRLFGCFFSLFDGQLHVLSYGGRDAAARPVGVRVVRIRRFGHTSIMTQATCEGTTPRCRYDELKDQI